MCLDSQRASIPKWELKSPLVYFIHYTSKREPDSSRERAFCCAADRVSKAHTPFLRKSCLLSRKEYDCLALRKNLLGKFINESSWSDRVEEVFVPATYPLYRKKEAATENFLSPCPWMSSELSLKFNPCRL
jgi:hypothetical protein